MVRSLILFLLLSGCAPPKTILIISKTVGFRHDSIETGVKAISDIATDLEFEVIATEDSSGLCNNNYDVVVFLNTTGNILNEQEQQCLREFVESGGGFLGIHAAADTEYDWPWYGETLLGAWFVSHPPISEEAIEVVNSQHLSTKHLPQHWLCTDEWYVYDRTPSDATILMEVHGHPIAWCSDIGNGRSFYTGRGHTIESYSDQLFRQHLRGGIEWVSEREF
ncbi:MAG: ThuA domain-containing protein [Phycisphaerales bacterium]|jgi:type 1 glutamine amidotransferase|nr:ThuA domain-containing protein [Phycisphaerales bacterium]